MGKTSIEWTSGIRPDGSVIPGYTFNPWWGCTKVAPECAHCYAESLSKRYGRAQWGPSGTRVKTSEKNWAEPLKWNREAEEAGERRRVFCASMADVFEDWTGPVLAHDRDELRQCLGCRWMGTLPVFARELAPSRSVKACPQCGCGTDPIKLGDLRDQLFKLIDATPHLDWLLLTKRPENVLRMIPDRILRPATPEDDHRSNSDGPLDYITTQQRSNVWLGTSAGTQATADVAIPELRRCRDLAPVLFVSCEPMLERVDFSPWLTSIDWLIVGGESGPGARACEIGWVRSVVEQCRDAGVSTFVKQLGSVPYWGWPQLPVGLRVRRGNHAVLRLEDRKGGDPSEWPADLRVREFPQQREVAHA